MEAHLCVRNNSYLIFVRNFQKNEPERRSGLKKPERRSGAFRSNSNPERSVVIFLYIYYVPAPSRRGIKR